MPLSPRNLLKLRDEFALTAATAFALLIQFVFQSVVVRSISPQEFGLVSSLLAIQGILNIPIAIWQLAQARRLASFWGSTAQFRDFSVHQLFSIRFPVAIGLALYFLLGPLIKAYINETSWNIWVLVVLGCLFSVVESWGLACFQSRHAFGWLGTVSVGAAAARLLSIWILLPNMENVTAVLVSVLSGFLIPIVSIILYLRISQRMPEGPATETLELSLVPASLATVFTISWLNFDFMIARNRLDAVMAGEYATVAVLCKAVFWFTSAIGTIYLPRFVKAQSMGIGAVRPMLRKALLICMAVCGAALLTVWPISGWLVQLFAGSSAQPQMDDWLRYMVAAKIPGVCVVPFLAYFVARDSKRILLIILSLLALTFLYAQTFSDHVHSLLWIIFSGGMAILLFCLLAVRLQGERKDLEINWD
jgi:O-antigen/teichoic acid export membrane protein